MAATFMMKLVMHQDEEGDGQDEHQPGGLLEPADPMHRQPFRRLGVTEAEADGHGPAEEQDDVPGDGLQVFHGEGAGEEEEHACRPS